MKKVISIVLALLMVLSLSACGKSEDVVIVEGFINDIGTVTLDSGDAIEKALHAYSMLSDKEKSKVENYNLLIDADYAYSKLLEEQAAQTDTLIVDARALFENDLNVTGALELLNTARETATKDQLNEIDTLTAEIEEVCYPGTHFIMFENVTDLDINLAASNATDALDIYLYTADCSVGGFTDYFYTDKVTGYEAEYMSPPPEWLSDLTDNGMGVVFYYDDLGNVLVEYDTYKGGKGHIDIFIFYADFVASQS